MSAIRRPGWYMSTAGGIGIALLAAVLSVLAPPPEAKAQGQCDGDHSCFLAGCGHDWCHIPMSGAGGWYWMRNPDQERAVISCLFNRYCVRCHRIDGRGVWNIPDVPDFTDARWQASRPDQQLAGILMRGRGGVMPSFRGTLTVEEAWAMARYLRTFAPAPHVAPSYAGRSANARQGTEAATALPPLPTASRPASTLR